MVKKRVPEWLNSSLWSSDDHRDLPHSTAASSATYAHEEREHSSVGPPLPEPSPPSPPVREDPPPPQIIEDSRTTTRVADDRNATSSAPSSDDISRQAQLLAEVHSPQNQLFITQSLTYC